LDVPLSTSLDMFPLIQLRLTGTQLTNATTANVAMAYATQWLVVTLTIANEITPTPPQNAKNGPRSLTLSDKMAVIIVVTIARTYGGTVSS
jgi:hypothetical protein